MIKKLIKLIIIFFIMGIPFIMCNKKLYKEKIVKDDDKSEIENSNEEKDSKQMIIDSMSLDEKVGQLIIVGIDGTSIDEKIKMLVKEKYVSGIILFSDNVKGLNEVKILNNELKMLNKDNKLPLFISVDEEGGNVSRTPKEFEKLPSSFYIGSFQNREIAYKVGEIIGEELELQGYNMDYAPVLDILSNSKNTVIGKRAFGVNADIVSTLGIEAMKGIKNRNIISVVKHFPGHGDTSIDSHYGLPLVTKTLEELKSLEFIPFKEAIENGADAIMVSHILLEKVDNENPASMSKVIINNILRNEMNFKGLVITDDMTMGAIMENYDISEAAIKSINAGCDIILVCHGYDNELKVIDAIKTAVVNGIISEKRIDESVYRILELKEKYKLSDEHVKVEKDVADINEKIQNLFKEYE